MLQIRRNVFETNSSSSHSISIKKEGRWASYDEIKSQFFINKDGIVRFWEDELEFDRSPFEVLGKFRKKFAFALASYKYDDNKIEELLGLFKELIPEVKEIKFPTDPYDEEDAPYYGHIDHQSQGLLQGFLLDNNVSLRDFLLNNKYIVFIDGDEYCVKEDLIENGIIDKNNFELL